MPGSALSPQVVDEADDDLPFVLALDANLELGCELLADLGFQAQNVCGFLRDRLGQRRTRLLGCRR